MTRIKQPRTRKAGFRGSLNTQDFPRKVYTPAERRVILRDMTSHYVAMLGVWGTGTKLQQTAKAACELVIMEAGE